MDKRITDKKLIIEWKYIYRGMCAVILTAIAGGSFFLVWHKFVFYYAGKFERAAHLRGIGNQMMAVILYMAMYILIGHGLRAFAIGVERVSNIVASQVITLLMTNLGETFVSMAIAWRWRYWAQFLWKYIRLFFLQSITICVIAVLMIRLYRILFPPIDILEIYGRKNGLYGKVNQLQYKYHISESIFADELSLEEVKERIQEHQAVLLNDLPAQRRNTILKACFRMDKRVYLVPKISDVIMKNSEELRLFDTPMLLCRNREISWWQRIIKRGLDILFSLIGLIVLSPVFAVTAIAIHVEDKGPVLYKQERVTRGGKKFQMLKFRSMIVNAEADGRPHPAGEKDPRITKTGSFIRACRIDELPQLINILRGDMSIVGPRPERVEHVEKYSKLIPEFDFRLKMKGGLTGYAQVYGKYNTAPLDKLKLDLTYITNYSLVTDVQIVFETFKILFLKESTEGFEEEENA